LRAKIENPKSRIQNPSITRFFLPKVAVRAQIKKSFFEGKQPIWHLSHLKNYLAEKVFSTYNIITK
jgi:hypothetical protein